MIDFSQFPKEADAVKWVMETKGMTKAQARKWVQEKVPKEQYYQTKIMEWIKKNLPEAFVWKATQGAYSRLGIPDICVVAGGRFYGFEVKRPYYGTASTMQKETIKQILAAGGKAYVVTYAKEVAEILQTEMEKP